MVAERNALLLPAYWPWLTLVATPLLTGVVGWFTSTRAARHAVKLDLDKQRRDAGLRRQLDWYTGLNAEVAELAASALELRDVVQSSWRHDEYPAARQRILSANEALVRRWGQAQVYGTEAAHAMLSQLVYNAHFRRGEVPPIQLGSNAVKALTVRLDDVVRVVGHAARVFSDDTRHLNALPPFDHASAQRAGEYYARRLAEGKPVYVPPDASPSAADPAPLICTERRD